MDAIISLYGHRSKNTFIIVINSYCNCIWYLIVVFVYRAHQYVSKVIVPGEVHLISGCGF